LINDIAAAGSTLDELRARITIAARQYVENPHVTVAAKEINSRKVFLTGEVARPGAYSVRGRLTVLQLIAMAGGLNQFAQRERILILRTLADGNNTLTFNYAALLAGHASAQDVVLRPGDTVVVP
jgi:polysaccharide export outer membrane protein